MVKDAAEYILKHHSVLQLPVYMSGMNNKKIKEE